MAGRVGDTMKTTPAVACIKTILMVFNIIFWITGIAVLALGVWMKIQLYMFMTLTTVYYNQAPFVLIGIGCGIVVVGTLGCCCTVKGNACLLYMYSMFLVVVFIAEFSVSIAAFIFRGKISEGFQAGLQDALKVYKTDQQKKEVIDELQSTLHCCGIKVYSDWFNTPWAEKKNTVPKSCCIKPENCINTALPATVGKNETLGVYTEGCYEKVTTFISNNFLIMGGVAIGFAFLQLFGAVLACCLAKNINKAKYEQVA